VFNVDERVCVTNGRCDLSNREQQSLNNDRKVLEEAWIDEV